MDNFSGLVVLEGTLRDYLLTRDANKLPVAPDAAPTWRVYGPSGLLSLAQGTCSNVHSGAVTGATNATPIVITSANHGLANGMRVTITGVGGNTAANTTAVVSSVTTNTFALTDVAGNGDYTTGGTFVATGFYYADIEATGANGFTSGQTYSALFTWAVSSAARSCIHTFTVG